jgi:PilZ domain
MNEKRSFPRSQAFLKAQAFCPGKPEPIDCLVCDLSKGGARLQPADGGAVAAFPDRFEFIVSRTGVRHSARVAWRSSAELGVAFD